MKNKLIYFDNLYKKIKNNLVLEDTDNKSDENVKTQITVDAKATVNDKQVPVTVNASEDINIDNINIDTIDININIKKLKLKLENQLAETKKKAYASRLYSTKVGNNPDALRDYGYFLGQKNILTSILKELNNLCIEIDEMEENKDE